MTVPAALYSNNFGFLHCFLAKTLRGSTLPGQPCSDGDAEPCDPRARAALFIHAHKAAPPVIVKPPPPPQTRLAAASPLLSGAAAARLFRLLLAQQQAGRQSRQLRAKTTWRPPAAPDRWRLADRNALPPGAAQTARPLLHAAIRNAGLRLPWTRHLDRHRSCAHSPRLPDRTHCLEAPFLRFSQSCPGACRVSPVPRASDARKTAGPSHGCFIAARGAAIRAPPYAPNQSRPGGNTTDHRPDRASAAQQDCGLLWQNGYQTALELRGNRRFQPRL